MTSPSAATGSAAPMPSATPPASYIDLAREPSLLGYDASITLPISHKYEFNNQVIRHFNHLEPNFMAFYAGRGLTLSSVREMIRTWTHLFSSHLYQRNVADAMARYLSGAPKQRTVVDQTVWAAMQTRRARWNALASHVGVPSPAGFRVFRGMIDKGGYLTIRSVIESWRMRTPLAIPMKRAASFSLLEQAATDFATAKAGVTRGVGLSTRPVPGVIFDTDAPFYLTLADKLVDGGRFIVPWWNQYEIIVGGLSEDYLLAHHERIKVILDGRVYDYTQEAQLKVAFAAKGVVI